MEGRRHSLDDFSIGSQGTVSDLCTPNALNVCIEIWCLEHTDKALSKGAASG